MWNTREPPYAFQAVGDSVEATQLTSEIQKLMADRARGWTLLLLLVGFLMLHDTWLDATQINLANIALTKALRTPQELGPVLTGQLAQADAGTARLVRAQGVALLSAGQPVLAVAAFERAAALEGQAPDPVTQMWLGEAYRTMGDLEGAIVAWDRAGGVDMLNRKENELWFSQALARDADLRSACTGLARVPRRL